VIRVDPNRQGLLYAGTELGIHVSFDDGANWQPLESNLPVTPIHDIVVKDTDLVAGTHGRSFWILDDLTPLHQMQEATSTEPVVLFKPRPTIRFRFYGRAFGRTPGITNYKMTGPVTVAYRPVETASGATREAFLDAGNNPPDGVIVHYYLKDAQEDEVTLEILDGSGDVIRSFSNKSENPPRLPVRQGANRFVWDMRGKKATPLDEPPANDRFGQMMEEAVAPRVVPGTYGVRLKVGETTLSESFEILPDPRLPVTTDDLQRQFELKSSIRDDLSRVHEALNQLRKIRKQVEAWEERFKDSEDRSEIRSAASAAKDALSEIEAVLTNVDSDKPQPGTSKLKEKLVALSVMIDESDDAPTRGAEELHAQLGDQVESTQARLGQVVRDDVEKLNQLLASSSVQIIETS
jgi:hypothetical protein